MFTVLLTLQFFLVIALIACVLLQQSTSDALSGLANGGQGVISNRSSASFVTKFTFFLAFCFMTNSLCLAKITIVSFQKSDKVIQIIDQQLLDLEPSVPISE